MTEDGTPASSTSDDDSSLDDFFDAWKMCIDEVGQLMAAMPQDQVHPCLKALHLRQKRGFEKGCWKRQRGLLQRHYYSGLGSSNWTIQWSVIKKFRGLMCVDKTFQRSPYVAIDPSSNESKMPAWDTIPFQQSRVIVDAVVDGGATWLKFLSISRKTLEYQVMAEGWENEGWESEDEGGHSRADNLRHIPFVDNIRSFVQAARWNHCPHLHLLVLTLREGESEVVDRVLNYVRTEIGGRGVAVTISCSNSAFLTEPPPDLSTAIASVVERDPVVGDDCRRITSTLNLDPGVLVSLVTDVHHSPVPKQPVLQQDIINYTLAEVVPRKDILANLLFPILRGRRLVCTKFAASYFRQLISTLSTSSEEARASLLLPPEGSSASREELLAEYQEWTNVPVPSDLLFPVEIVDDVDIPQVESMVSSGRLPPMALGVSQDLSRLNRSVYLYGWANGLTTLSGNRGIGRQIQLSLARHWEPSENGTNDNPPNIYQRYLGAYLIHRDKPKNWRDLIGVAEGGEVPSELIRWTYPLTTWGRGVGGNGLPDSKTWPGVGHDEQVRYSLKTVQFEQKNKQQSDGRMVLPHWGRGRGPGTDDGSSTKARKHTFYQSETSESFPHSSWHLEHE
ncbi:hypothetical protein QBC34DRAFT_484172 [Podospora aff. communis PSN243]|uniref:DUF1308 domain-containing protein n=1 Tax=Podospora aff. communis PSN243 TaxID=3040156 RepID=A0AAV9GTF9_9PEZI|nr:hypothetical protein QBC34DRAFT_484172 [Podospora aff. communis PSN243]